MRIIVMSDSHGNLGNVEKIINKNKDADMFIHLGDGEREINAVRIKYPDIELVSVRGNCDFSWDAPESKVVECNGVKIFCTHGHRYHVREDTEALRSTAWVNGCTVALFGHTHERYIASENGIDIMNPGSCSSPRDGNKPSYGFIDIVDAGVFLNIIDVGF